MVDHNGVRIVGYSNVGRLAATASSLYVRNLYAFIETLVDKASKSLAVKWDDELVKATLLTRDGAVVHTLFGAAAQPTASQPAVATASAPAVGTAAAAAPTTADAVTL